jgi:hypothetical protein
MTGTKTVRLIAAAAVVVSAVVHFKLWLDFKSVDVVGPAFMVNAVGGVVIAVLLLTWKHWLAPLLAAGFGIATLAAFIVSTTPSGLFDVHEKWTGGYVWTAAISEVVAIITGLYAFTAERRTSAPVRERTPVGS